MELYRKYRPKTLAQVVGQEAATLELAKRIEKNNVPHVVLLSGQSGTGKTTIARIIRRGIGCHKDDFIEINAANFRGIEVVRDIQNKCGMYGTGKTKRRMWLIDEVHQMTNAAQSAFLKTLEDTPKVSYFVMATTEAHKLLRTFRDRCLIVALKPIAPKAMLWLLNDIAAKEKFKLSEEVAEKIVNCADGSARRALVFLEKIINFDTEDEQLEAIMPDEEVQAATNIAFALLNTRNKWGDMLKVLRAVDHDEAKLEKLRRMILTIMANTMMKGGKSVQRAADVIEVFQYDFFTSLRAGFLNACYRVLHS